ncbi:MAG TPA: glycerophosphodiester phosphodiesterase, partial [Aquabacterium sp.]|nr:glycerophosphodiester phosphodiesterase [Aquabacterium sp.]
SELSRVDAGGWHSRAYAGEAPPTLAAVARWLRANGFDLDLEIKPSPGLERETGRAVALACRTLWQQAPRPPLLSRCHPRPLPQHLDPPGRLLAPLCFNTSADQV